MDTRKTLRASPAALVAMHSNRPSSRGLGLVMSSNPEDWKLHGQSTRQGQPLPHGEQQERENPTLWWDPFSRRGGQCCWYL